MLLCVCGGEGIGWGMEVDFWATDRQSSTGALSYMRGFNIPDTKHSTQRRMVFIKNGIAFTLR